MDRLRGLAQQVVDALIRIRPVIGLTSGATLQPRAHCRLRAIDKDEVARRLVPPSKISEALAVLPPEVGGIKNARTSKEFTLFFNQVPAEQFERSILMLSEQLQNSLLKPESIFSEMQVILQEINRAYDTPAKLAYEKTREHVFQNHPLGHMVLGTKESILNFKREDFASFMEHHYYPKNYTFLIAGKVEPDEAENIINKYFADTSNKENSARENTAYKRPENREVVFTSPINQAHINIVAPIESTSEKEKICLNLFSIMLGAGASSPLFHEIRTKKGLCYSITSGFYAGTDVGLFRVTMATGIDKYREAIESVFLILEKTKTDGDRLKRAKQMKLGRIALNMENPLDIISWAASDIALFGHPIGQDEISTAINSVGIEDIKQTVDKYLSKENFYTVLLMPESPK